MMEISVRVIGLSGGETEGKARVQELTARDRWRRALKALAIGLGIAVGGVLLPLVHFVLVPLALLATPIVSVYFLRQAGPLLRGGSATCPKCRADLAIAPGQARWPVEDVCSRCFERVKIQPAFSG